MPRDVVRESLGTLYAAPLQPHLWDDFLRGLCSASGVNKAAIIVRDLARNDHHILASSGDSVRESAQVYETRYAQFDEWALRYPKHSVTGRVLQGELLCPEHILLQSVFYNEFLKRFDVIQAAFLAYMQPGIFESLSIFRGPSEQNIGTEQLDWLKILSPHIQTALYTRRKLLSLENRIGDLENALDQLPAALVLLDIRGDCLLVNKAAKAILDQRNGLLLARNGSGRVGLCATSVIEMAKLREIVSGSIATSEGKSSRGRGAMLVSRLDRKPLQIVVAPFRQASTATTGMAAAIVFINDPEQKATIPTDVLRMLFGVTAAEARLMLTLLAGNSLVEAAEIHSVSRETVRSQIKSIFQKTDTRRQGELIRVLVGVFSRDPSLEKQ